ncbi:unnamed protein product [Lupinus luteus]|uniref:Secreted protein n=1 Tax=Lupinus luteus TaxID=3873 RepID=A0AAV1WU49_LUPLU
MTVLSLESSLFNMFILLLLYFYFTIKSAYRCHWLLPNKRAYECALLLLIVKKVVHDSNDKPHEINSHLLFILYLNIHIKSCHIYVCCESNISVLLYVDRNVTSEVGVAKVQIL